VLPDRVLDDGALLIEGDRLSYAGPAAHCPAPLPPLESGTMLLPGLVDVHNHGGGGVGFPDAASAGDARIAVAEHLAHGTTSIVASLVTAARGSLLRQAEMLGELAAAGEIAGIHAEGPFLAPARCGAHDPALLVPGDVNLVRDLVAASGGHLRAMTVAAEVPGAVAVADALIDAGVIASLGHTDASAEQAEAFLAHVAPRLRERGLTATVTHLFNAMPPVHHRAPGAVAAALAAAARGEVVVELIADGVHVAPATIRMVAALVGADAVAYVTDAMAAAGMADGAYRLGSLAVEVRDGVARLAGPGDGSGSGAGPGAAGAIAGGTSHLLDVVRTAVAAGVPLVDAVRSGSWVPAQAFGLRDVGGLVAGRRADVLITDTDLHPRRVVRAGTLVGA
jgi:N-acetylglucosamine-6-phosphate deacetylase